MATVTSNELKTKGVSFLSKIIDKEGEAIITVHGKESYVVLPMSMYNDLREAELDRAILEAKKDIESGKFHSDGVDAHMRRMGIDVQNYNDRNL